MKAFAIKDENNRYRGKSLLLDGTIKVYDKLRS